MNQNLPSHISHTSPKCQHCCINQKQQKIVDETLQHWSFHFEYFCQVLACNSSPTDKQGEHLAQKYSFHNVPVNIKDKTVSLELNIQVSKRIFSSFTGKMPFFQTGTLFFSTPYQCRPDLQVNRVLCTQKVQSDLRTATREVRPTQTTNHGD